MEGDGEGVDVLAANPDVAAELLGVVEGLLGQTRPQATGERRSEAEQEELLESLRELGYAGEG